MRTLRLTIVLGAMLGLALGCDPDPTPDPDTGPTPMADTGPMTMTDTGPMGMPDTGPAPTPDAGTDAGPPPPPMPRGMANPPTPGAQIDRMGRAAASTAFIMAFQPDEAMRNTAKDAYNANDDQSTWAADHAAQIEGSIAVYDGLDLDCGNQLAADLDDTDRYSALASVLANDVLWVNADGDDACTTYLGVEADFLGITNADCGGRAPTYDVINRSYSVLVNGSLSDINDEITEDDATHSDTVFPFFAAPL